QPCPCGSGSLMDTRCSHCVQYTTACTTCFRESHIHQPFHWSETWNGRFFERIYDPKARPALHLGHGGRKCPEAAEERHISFTIADTSGVHQMSVVFCRCFNHGDRAEQLMDAKLFPASMDQPTTAFTFSLLRDFHMHSLTSKKSAYDFVLALRRLSNNAFPDSVPDIYPQFLCVIRVWRYLIMLKRSGQMHAIDNCLPGRPPGSVIVPCFACPERGLNTTDDLRIAWHLTRLRHLRSLILSADGHFGLQRKSKKDDPDDISLVAGRAFFPDESTFKSYLAKIKSSEEKSTCSRFNAIEMQNKLKFKGMVTSGVVAVTCARHGLFRHGGLTDLERGEKYANTDYALAQVLKHYKDYTDILLSYDIACQYMVNLVQRFEVQFPELVKTVRGVEGRIPSMHVDGHLEKCTYRFGFSYNDGGGRTDAESIERGWSEQKQAGGSTREMNAGHRHDTLTDFMNDYNFTKIRKLASSMHTRLSEAREALEEHRVYFLHLCREAGQNLVDQWSAISTKPELRNGKWYSIICPCGSFRALVPSQKSAFASLVQSEAATAGALKGAAPRALFLYTGLKLEEQQLALRNKVSKLSSQPTAADLLSIDKERQKLRYGIKQWRSQQCSLMPLILPLIVQSHFAEPENEVLYLPSDIDGTDKREAYGLSQLADEEMSLHVGEAHDYLQNVRHAVRYYSCVYRHKVRHAQGIAQNTRAGKLVQSANEAKLAWIAKYNHARDRMIKLGRSPSDPLFPALKEEDTWMKDVIVPHTLGDGSR
ncbi:hypothetical protein PUNSTDRAFT_30488, partial [Punctularia strigosozonata HHB-11173 SS5]